MFLSSQPFAFRSSSPWSFHLTQLPQAQLQVLAAFGGQRVGLSV